MEREALITYWHQKSYTLIYYSNIKRVVHQNLKECLNIPKEQSQTVNRTNNAMANRNRYKEKQPST